MPGFRDGGGPLDDLEQTRGALATTDAHRHDCEFRAAALALDESMPGQSRARHAVGMSDSNRTPLTFSLSSGIPSLSRQ